MSLRIDGIVNAVKHFKVFLVAHVRLDGGSRGGRWHCLADEKTFITFRTILLWQFSKIQSRINKIIKFKMFTLIWGDLNVFNGLALKFICHRIMKVFKEKHHWLLYEWSIWLWITVIIHDQIDLQKGTRVFRMVKAVHTWIFQHTH